LAVNPHSVRRGQTVVLTGSGFKPGATVTITFHSKPYRLGQVVAGRDGQFSASVTVPESAAGGPHHFEAVGAQLGGGTTNISAAVDVVGVAGHGGPTNAQKAILVGVALALPAGAWLGMSVAGAWRRRRSAKPLA
jgi:hypothetical protein